MMNAIKKERLFRNMGIVSISVYATFSILNNM